MASYGFDFLRAEHNEPTKSTPDDQAANHQEDAEEEAVVNTKTPLEKQFDVLNFLKRRRLMDDANANKFGNGSNGVKRMYSVADILQHTNIDLSEDLDVAAMLEANPRIRVKSYPVAVEDEEDSSSMMNMYVYESKFQVSSKKELLALVNRCKNGICAKDLRDAYQNVDADLQDLICSGEIIAVANSEVRDKTLFPRNEVFLVQLDGHVDVPSNETNDKEEKSNGNKDSERRDDVKSQKEGNGSAKAKDLLELSTLSHIDTSKDLTKELRRGEAVWIGGQWFRVSSSIRDGVPLAEQPPRAQAPLSVSSIQDLSKKNELDGYCLEFIESKIPIDRMISKDTLDNLLNGKEARDKLNKLGGPPPSSSSRSSVIRRKRPNNSATSSSNFAARTAAAANPDLSYCKARRHGCSKDVRDMYLASRSEVPDSEVDLYRLLVSNKLIEEGEPMRRPRIRKKVENTVNGKAKKKRYYVRKGHKITNTHLAGTEIGAVLAMASERQQQGKDVGDGGM